MLSSLLRRFGYRSPAERQNDDHAAPSSTVPTSRYRPELHGTPESFARHADFKAFGAHVTGLTGALKAYIPQDAQACRAMDEFRDHVLEVNADGVNRHFGAHASGVYELGIDTLERLVTIAADPRTDPDQRRTELLDLSHQILLCPVGVIDCLLSSLQRLAPAPQSLPAKWEAARKQIARDIVGTAVTEEFADTLRVAGGSHIHLVHPLLAQVGKALRIDCALPPDPLASRSVPSALVKRCLDELAVALHPACIAETVAGDYVGRLWDGLRGSSPGAGNGSAPTMEQIGAVIESLASEFGSKPHPSAVIRIDMDSGRCGPATDLTMLALHFLKQRDRGHWTNRGQKPERVATAAKDVTFFKAGRLAWAVEERAPRPLTAADLMLLKPGDIPSTAVAQAIRNDMPDESVGHLDLRWVRDVETAEALCDRLDDEQMRPLIKRCAANGVEGEAVLLRIRDALTGRDRRALMTGNEAGWIRLSRPDALSAVELVRSLRDTENRAERLGHVRRALETALAPLSLQELRVLGPRPRDGAPDTRQLKFASQWIISIRVALMSDLRPWELNELLSSPAKGGGHIVPVDDPEALRLLRALIGLVEPLHRIEPNANTLALLQALLGIQDNGPSRLLQAVWSHGHAKDFILTLDQSFRAMCDSGFSPDEARTALALLGTPAEDSFSQVLAGLHEAIDFVQKSGLSMDWIKFDIHIKPPTMAPDGNRLELPLDVELRIEDPAISE